jgi:hypothetical protein
VENYADHAACESSVRRVRSRQRGQADRHRPTLDENYDDVPLPPLAVGEEEDESEQDWAFDE